MNTDLEVRRKEVLYIEMWEPLSLNFLIYKLEIIKSVEPTSQLF